MSECRDQAPWILSYSHLSCFHIDPVSTEQWPSSKNRESHFSVWLYPRFLRQRSPEDHSAMADRRAGFWQKLWKDLTDIITWPARVLYILVLFLDQCIKRGEPRGAWVVKFLTLDFGSRLNLINIWLLILAHVLISASWGRAPTLGSALSVEPA